MNMNISFISLGNMGLSRQNGHGKTDFSSIFNLVSVSA
ncbi:hypothetical protein L291_4331 [Acinetobacter guillouiae MSP4-18]|nr:hypothetical protein L291_4331 [Acinetobacter guillouiae MSP4-18]